MFDYETISVEAKDGVHWLTLNRPESLNAINTQMATELRDYFSELFQDRSCRVVVMKGAGRAYCAGRTSKTMQAWWRRHLVGDLVSKATWLTFTSKCGDALNPLFPLFTGLRVVAALPSP